MNNTGTNILDALTATQAIQFALPSAMSLLQSASNRKKVTLHIVVINPNIEVNNNMPMDQAILAEYSIGKRKWNRDYRKIAFAKALLTARTKFSSRVVIEQHPEMLQMGDVLYAGSSISESGIIVAASGAESHFDETISRIVLDIIFGLASHQVYEAKQAGAIYLGQ